MDGLALDAGVRAAFGVVDATNEYIASSEPWTLARSEETQRALDQVLWSAAEGLRIAAVMLSPVMPGSAGEILRRLGVAETEATAPRFERDLAVRASGERTLTRAAALWPRLEEASSAAPVSTKESVVTDQPKSAPEPAPPAPAPAAAPTADARISIDEFMKIDLRVARITAAERVPNSRKLVKLTVDLGSEQRTLVAGIAEAYEADSLVGRHVAIVANLKPAKLMGIESNGMVLAASPEGGKPILVTFDEAPPLGSRVR
jgi:methionyl-tRNA synthetase